MTSPEIAIRGDRNVSDHLNLLEVWLRSRMSYANLPGAVIGIVHDQNLIYARGFGYADIDSRRQATPDSIFRIASHSKLFTAISIMQLRDAGKLQLDDPIEGYLPWFIIQNRHPESRPITIRHLLTHTSGLPREAGSNYWLDFNFPTLEQVKDRLPGQSTVFPTETKWKYSNLALALAGEIVAEVSGTSYADYVQHSILQPLGMTSTSVVFPDDLRVRLVTPYSRRMPDGSREALPFVDAIAMAAATGLSSTVEDMARFIAWQFRLLGSDNHEVLAASTLREMQRVHWLQSDWKSGWGIGFSIQHHDSRDLIGHGGGYPGNLTSTQISPKERVGVIVFTNSLDSTPQVISERVFDWLAQPVTAAAASEGAVAVDAAWEQYTGTYRNLWTDTHVTPLDGKLMMFTPTTENPKADALTLEPAGENTFTIEGKGSGPLGEAVIFDVGPDGTASRVKVGEGWSDRVEYPTPMSPAEKP